MNEYGKYIPGYLMLSVDGYPTCIILSNYKNKKHSVRIVYIHLRLMEVKSVIMSAPTAGAWYRIGDFP